MRELEPIARFNIRSPNMVKRGLTCSKQNWKWMLTRLWKNENIASYVCYYEESYWGFLGGSLGSQPPCHLSMTRLKLLLSIYLHGLGMLQSWASELVIKMEQKIKQKRGGCRVGDNENGIGCGKPKWREKVLWQGEKFTRLLLGVMDVKLARLIVTLGGDWGVQAPWDLLPFKL